MWRQDFPVIEADRAETGPGSSHHTHGYVAGQVHSGPHWYAGTLRLDMPSFGLVCSTCVHTSSLCHLPWTPFSGSEEGLLPSEEVPLLQNKEAPVRHSQTGETPLLPSGQVPGTKAGLVSGCGRSRGWRMAGILPGVLPRCCCTTRSLEVDVIGPLIESWWGFQCSPVPALSESTFALQTPVRARMGLERWPRLLLQEARPTPTCPAPRL